MKSNSIKRYTVTTSGDLNARKAAKQADKKVFSLIQFHN